MIKELLIPLLSIQTDSDILLTGAIANQAQWTLELLLQKPGEQLPAKNGVGGGQSFVDPNR
jgi:hypothetical protein